MADIIFSLGPLKVNTHREQIKLPFGFEIVSGEQRQETLEFDTSLKTVVDFLKSSHRQLSEEAERRGEQGALTPMGLERQGFRSVLQMLMLRNILAELYSVVFTVTELRYSIYSLRREIFRRGGDVKPKFAQQCTKCAVELPRKIDPAICPECGGALREPDLEQKKQLKDKITNVNPWDQSLIDVLREVEDDVNIVDDAFVLIIKQYARSPNDPQQVLGRVTQVVRHDPASIQFDLDQAGVPGRSHGACRIHRDGLYQLNRDTLGNVVPDQVCLQCGLPLTPIMFVAEFVSGKAHLFGDEVIHFSKFSPSKLYGFSPVLTILEPAMAVAGADRSYYNVFYRRKLARGLIVSVSPDVAGLQAERERAEQKLKKDPDYVPWILVKSSSTGRGDTKWIPLGVDPTVQTYSGVLGLLRARLPLLWGVIPPGGGSTATKDLNLLQVQTHAVEDAQLIYNMRVLPAVVTAWGITDWTYELLLPEERQEEAILARMERRSGIAKNLWQMGFDIALDGVGDLQWSGKSKPPQPKATGGLDIGSAKPDKMPSGSGDFERDERGMARRIEDETTRIIQPLEPEALPRENQNGRDNQLAAV